MNINKEEIQRLEKAITNLRKLNYFKIYESTWKLILFSLIRGLASGLGWIIGASILVSLLTYLLSQIEFIPIFGELISLIIKEIETFER